MNYGILFFSILILVFPMHSYTQIDISSNKRERELVTCESEAAVFWIASVAASLTPYERVSKMPGGEGYSFTTSDGVELQGIRLTAAEPANTYLLIMQGNGFPAGRIIQEFGAFQKRGIDVYALDYRGYKRSEGKRRFGAILQDYAEILAALNDQYERHFVYATSFGGVVAANVITDYTAYEIVLFDSVISDVSKIFTCNQNYNPVEHLGDDCSSLIVQSNTEDRFYKNGHLQDLENAAAECDGSSVLLPKFGHPFEEPEDKVDERMTAIMKILEEKL